MEKARPFAAWLFSLGVIFLFQRKRYREALYATAIEGGPLICPGSRSVEIPLESPEVTRGIEAVWSFAVCPREWNELRRLRRILFDQ